MAAATGLRGVVTFIHFISKDRSNAARRAPLDAGVPGPNLRIPASVGDRW